MEKKRLGGRKTNSKVPIKKNIVIIENDDDTEKKTHTSSEKGSNWCTKIVQTKTVVNTINDIRTKKEDRPLHLNWVLWCHKLSSNDWSLNGFEQLYTIKTVKNFWSVFCNLSQLGTEYMHFYLMKENINPIWEDDNNRNGGICSIKIEFQQACKIMEDLCAYMVTHTLLVDPHSINEVNGIAFSPKINSRNSFAIVKIWNKNKENDTSKLLNGTILEKYDKLSIQYKQNRPEY